MIFIWLCFLSGQTIPDTLGAVIPALDTILTDSLRQDSVKADTMPVIYPVPDIVQYRDRDPDNAGFLSFQPRAYDLFLDDLLQSAGMLAKNGRLVTRGRVAPARAQLDLNSRVLENRIYGACDTRLMQLQCLESISPDGGDADLRTRINRYDRPYSHIRFTTLGNTTLYNLDLTRALNNNIGFYLSGVYSKHPAALSDSDETRNAFYGDFYTCGTISSRLDLIYSDRNLPGIEKGSMYDASLVLGKGPFRSRIFYNSQITEHDNSTGIRPRSRTAHIGAEFRGDHDLSPFRFDWEARFNTDQIRTRSVYPSYYIENDYLSSIDLAGEYDPGRFRFVLGARGETDFDSDWYPAPRGRIGFAPKDSQELFLSLDRTYHRPTIGEQFGAEYVYDPSYILIRSDHPKTEDAWRMVAGYNMRNITLTFFNDEITDYIKYAHASYDDTSREYEVINIPHGRIRGFDLCAILPLRWGFSIGAAGNYLLEHEDGSCPDYSIFGSLAWLHTHGRARYEICGWGRYLGGRYGWSGGDDRPVLYAAAAIRYIALSMSLRIENILDDTISDFTVPSRNVTLSIQWEFWN